MITEVDQVGKPMHPTSILGPYKTALGVFVRDHIPIKYRNWIKSSQNENNEWVVLDELQAQLWRKVQEKFTFPQACDQDAVRKRALQVLGNCFKNFKVELNKHVKSGTEPNGRDYPN